MYFYREVEKSTINYLNESFKNHGYDLSIKKGVMVIDGSYKGFIKELVAPGVLTFHSKSMGTELFCGKNYYTLECIFSAGFLSKEPLKDYIIEHIRKVKEEGTAINDIMVLDYDYFVFMGYETIRIPVGRGTKCPSEEEIKEAVVDRIDNYFRLLEKDQEIKDIVTFVAASTGIKPFPDN